MKDIKKDSCESKIILKEQLELKKEKLKILRHSQCARLYDAKTEWINGWFRYHK